MSKISRILIVLLALVALTPVTRAQTDQPISIKSATVETKSGRVVGDIKVCNSAKETVRFALDVKNLTINSIYKRNLSVPSSDCTTFKLKFTPDFAVMSNVGDEVRFVTKAVSGLGADDEYDFSNTYTTKVLKDTEETEGCADQFGKDGTFNVCEGDFIYHQLSGLRIRVMANNSDFVDLKLSHIEWGGVKDMRIYKGRTKKIRSNFNELKRVELSNVQGEDRSDLYIKIESAS